MENNTIDVQGLSLVDLLNIVIKNFILIFFCTMILTIIGVVYAFGIAKPTYRSTATVMIQVTSSGEINNSGDITNALRIVTTVSEFMSNDSIISTVAEQSGLTHGSIRSGLTIRHSTNSLNVIVSFNHADQGKAILVPNLIVREAKEFSNSKIENADGELDFQFSSIANTISIVNEAKSATIVSLNKIVAIIIFVFIGGVIGVCITFLKEVFNTTVRDPEELERKLKVKVIGEIPSFEIKGRKRYV